MCQIMATGNFMKKESAGLFEHAEEFNFAARVSLSEFGKIKATKESVIPKILLAMVLFVTAGMCARSCRC